MRSRFINRGVGVACASLLAGGAVANANGQASIPGAVTKRASPRAGGGPHHGKRASTRHAKKKASNRARAAQGERRELPACRAGRACPDPRDLRDPRDPRDFGDRA